MTLEEVLADLTGECQVDLVGLWEIIDAVRFDLGSTNASEIQMQTLRLVRELLQIPGMQVGHPAPDGRYFIAWDLPTEQVVNRIANEWSALGHEPGIGEVAWFTKAREPHASELAFSPNLGG